MKKTRKIKNKKLFLKWLKKSRSHINKYSIKHGGAPGKDKDNDNDKDKDKGSESDSSSQQLVSQGVVTKKNAIALAAVITLGEVAYSLASNPVVVSAIIGLGVGTTAFTAVASGGATLLLLAVGTYAYFKITAAYSNYYTMIHVMNDYILLLQKIDIMVRVAIKISQQYQFVIDTKDVNKSLERIFSKFDKLLSIEDIGKIQQEVQDNDSSIEKKLKSAAEDAADEIDRSQLEIDKPEEPKEISLKFTFIQKIQNSLTKVKNSTQKSLTKMKNSTQKFLNIVKFDSKKFTSQLNEEVMRLGLYFSILLGEFNIILNVSQMNIIEKRNFQLLLTKNTSVKSSDDFKKLLVSSIIYRTLQIYNIFALCTPGASISDAAKKTTCSQDSIKQYIVEVEAERVKIRKVLFGKSKATNKFLFPLYQDRSGNSSGLNILRGIMRGFNNSITEEKEAREFAKKIHEFNEKYSSATKETISDSSTGSTISTDHLVLGEDYYEDTEDSEEADEVPDAIPPPRKTAPPPPKTAPLKPPPALPLPRITSQPTAAQPVAAQQVATRGVYDENKWGVGPFNLQEVAL